MRSLLEVINESMSYKVYHDNMSYPNDRPHNIYVAGEHISDQGNKEIEEFLVNLVNKLNDVKIPITNKNYTNEYKWSVPGVFTFEVGKENFHKQKVPKKDSTGTYLQTAKYNGLCATVESGRNWDAIDNELFRVAIRTVFECEVTEAINDDDDKILDNSKELMNLVSYYNSIRDILKSTFNTSKLTRTTEMNYYMSCNNDLDINKTRSGLTKYPEIRYKHIYVRLLGFDISYSGVIHIKALFYEDR